tara:strand:- start:5663 stop:6244 length:582 start_codon:yes stop_codon:yes gene_type:complete
MKIKWLVSSTSDIWLKQAIDNPIEILIDHAHCERKAAGFAIQLMFRYIAEPGLSQVLSPLAREELEHFERVLKLLHLRGKSLIQLPSPPYASALSKNIRKEEPDRMLDSFLVAGLIEARSHERMSLLAVHSPDKKIRELYSDLLKSEARHFCLYWNLSEERFEKEKVIARLQQLAELEAQILMELHPQPRMHS